MYRTSRTKLVTSIKTKRSTPHRANFSTTIRSVAATQQQEFSLDSVSEPDQETKEEKPEVFSPDSISSPNQTTKSENPAKTSQPATEPTIQVRKLTVAEQDELLRRKMAGIEGDGGEAGVEYENGVPVAMKRSVKNNMFRYI